MKLKTSQPKKIILTTCPKKYYHQIKNGYDNIELMGFAMSSTLDIETNKYYTFKEKTNLLEYLNGNIVIGYNIIQYDSILLLGNSRVICDDKNAVYCPKTDFKWYNYDIYLKIFKFLLNMENEKDAKKIFEKLKTITIDKNIYSFMKIYECTINRKPVNIEPYPGYYQQNRIKDLKTLMKLRLNNLYNLYGFINNYKYIINGNYDVLKF